MRTSCSTRAKLDRSDLRFEWARDRMQYQRRTLQVDAMSNASDGFVCMMRHEAFINTIQSVNLTRFD